MFDSLKPPPEPEFISHAMYLCQHCGGRKQYDIFDDLPVCIDCGIQDAAFISDEPEWRSGGDDGQTADPSRVGAPVNLDHFSEAWGSSTVMKVQRFANRQTCRLAMINLHSSMNHKDRALFHAYNDFDKIGKSILGLPDCVMYAAKCKYKTFNEAVLTRGAVRNGIKANCIFQACKEFGVARTTQEIADAFGIPARDLSRTSELFKEQIQETKATVIQPADLVPRFFNSITGIPDAARGRIKAKCVKACRALEECVALMGRTPKAVACAVIFRVLSDLQIGPPKAELCRICEVSVPTLSKIDAIVKTRLKELNY